MSKHVIFSGVTGMLDADTSKSFVKQSTPRIYDSRSEKEKCQEKCSALALIFCSCLCSELVLIFIAQKTVPFATCLQGCILYF